MTLVSNPHCSFVIDEIKTKHLYNVTRYNLPPPHSPPSHISSSALFDLRSIAHPLNKRAGKLVYVYEKMID